MPTFEEAKEILLDYCQDFNAWLNQELNYEPEWDHKQANALEVYMTEKEK